MWWLDGRWHGRIEAEDAEPVSAETREGCLDLLRRAAGADRALVVEVVPDLVGVAEAAAVLGWDKRRIFTYLSRGSFPEPVAALASGRVWRRETVEEFARSRSRRRGPGRPA
jgi:predicted DNA-binding transcriptional regulator AlpA